MPEPTTLAIGNPAPIAPVTAPSGEPIAIDQLWHANPGGLALIFLRHYGCPFCKEHARAINERSREFADAGVTVLLIGCGTAEEAREFQATYAPNLAVGNDPERIAYQAYGLGTATVASLAHPKVLAGGVRAAAKGFLPRKSTGHPLQLQGQFLIDPTGTIQVAERPILMSDIPGPDTLLHAARTPVVA